MRKMSEKRHPQDTPSNLPIIARYILLPDISDILLTITLNAVKSRSRMPLWRRRDRTGCGVINSRVGGLIAAAFRVLFWPPAMFTTISF